MEYNNDFEDLSFFYDYMNFIDDQENLSGAAVLTPQKINEHFDELGKILNLLKVYPDILVDIITPVDSHFRLYFYQRILLRSFVRFKQTYATATRAASKSFLAFLSRYITCMQTPNHKTFVCAAIKKQAAAIAKEKIQEDIWVKFPLLKNEMIKIPQPGKQPLAPFVSGQDYATYNFTNGAKFDVVSVDSARGLRRHSGLIEEVIEQDQTKINEKIIPLLNVSRTTSKGEILPNEPHAAKIYVTTAGYKSMFAYDKFMETICYTVIDPQHYMAIGMSYEIPLMHGLLDPEQIREVISSPSFDRDSFDREYRSIWSGAMKGAAFDYNLMKRARIVNRAELKADKTDTDFYVISADLAKDGSANTAVVINRVSIGETHFNYKMVNALKIEHNDYMKVANELKKLIIRYRAALLVYDANGIGASLRDWLNKTTIDHETGASLPGYGVINPPPSAEKDLIRYNKKDTICYEVKANTQASDINYLFFGRLRSGAVKMLISAREAIEKYKEIKSFCLASPEKQKQYIRPYQFADQIEEELLNLDVVEITDTGRAALKVSRRNAKIQKDFFSAFSYLIWAVHNYIEMPYYKKRAKTRTSKLSALSSIQSAAGRNNNSSTRKIRHF